MKEKRQPFRTTTKGSQFSSVTLDLFFFMVFCGFLRFFVTPFLGTASLSNTKITKRTHFAFFNLPANIADFSHPSRRARKNEPIFNPFRLAYLRPHRSHESPLRERFDRVRGRRDNAAK